MEINIIKKGNKRVVEGPSAKTLIRISADVNSLLSACYDANTNLILLYSKNLPEEFFDISSKIAGEILQKFSNYNIRAAFVTDDNTKKSTRFLELANDLKVIGNIRFFENRSQALDWLFA